MTQWFTADPHYGHKNIIKYCNRPFDTVQDMDETMIDNHNAVVKPDDDVYIVGDFSMGGPEVQSRYLKRLNGRKHLIKGNHDRHPEKATGWTSVADYLELRAEDGTYLVLCHYGMRVWNGSYRGSVQLYGHSHGKLPGNSQSLDIGVDCWDYRPVLWKDIKQRLKTLPKYTPEDYVEDTERLNNG